MTFGEPLYIFANKKQGRKIDLAVLIKSNFKSNEK